MPDSDEAQESCHPLESDKGRYGKLSVEPLENRYNYRVDIGWVNFGTEVPKYRIPYLRLSAVHFCFGRDRADKTRYDYGNDTADRGIPQERYLGEEADRYHGQEAGKPTC